MISVKELQNWLKTLDKNDYVFVDNDGLTIYSFNNYATYIEIGGEKETYE
jgi:hypothetical protein